MVSEKHEFWKSQWVQLLLIFWCFWTTTVPMSEGYWFPLKSNAPQKNRKLANASLLEQMNPVVMENWGFEKQDLSKKRSSLPFLDYQDFDERKKPTIFESTSPGEEKKLISASIHKIKSMVMKSNEFDLRLKLDTKSSCLSFSNHQNSKVMNNKMLFETKIPLELKLFQSRPWLKKLGC